MLIPRIRSVKPEFFSHEGLYEAELLYKLPLRLAYIALFTCCDREGRFRWQPRRLKLDMLPYDDIDIAIILDAFIERGFIKKYEYNGELYGCIPSWSRHQKVNSRESDSELPPIEDSIEIEQSKTTSDHEITMPELSVTDDSVTRESRVVHASRACARGREMEGKGKEEEGKGSFVAPTRPVGEKQHIQEIFEHWKAIMKHPNAQLDDKRKMLIKRALRFGYSVPELCEAITGCSYTPHNIGDNDRGQRYDGIHVILRDGDQIDRFIEHCKHPPKALTEADRRSQANVHVLKNWMEKTIEEETKHASL